MKSNFLLTVFILCVCCGCGKKPVLTRSTDKPTGDRCKGVPVLNWQKEIQGADAATAAKIITDATLAAAADAKQSEDLKGSAKLDVNLKSELSRSINENVSKSSQVSDEFWEQELTFTRLYCLSISLMDRTDITAEQRSKLLNNISDLQKTEITYMQNRNLVEKKNGSSPK